MLMFIKFTNTNHITDDGEREVYLKQLWKTYADKSFWKSFLDTPETIPSTESFSFVAKVLQCEPVDQLIRIIEKGVFGDLLHPNKDLKRHDLVEISRRFHEVITPPSVDVSSIFSSCQKMGFVTFTVQGIHRRLMVDDYLAWLDVISEKKDIVSPREFYEAVEGSGIRNYARLLRILNIQITTMTKFELKRFSLTASTLQSMNEIRVSESFKDQPFDIKNVDPRLLSQLNISPEGELTITDRFKLGAVFHCSIYDDCQCKFCRSYDGNRRGVISLEQVAEKLGVSADVLLMLNENGTFISFMQEDGDVLSEDMEEIKELLDGAFAHEPRLNLLKRKYRFTDNVIALLGINLIAVYDKLRMLVKDFKRLSHVASFVVKNARRWDTSSFMANLEGDVLVSFGIQSVLTSEDYSRIAEIVKCFLPSAKIAIPGTATELTDEDLAEFDRVVVVKTKKTSKKSKPTTTTVIVATAEGDSDDDGGADDLRRIVLKKEHVAPSVVMGPRIIQGVSRGPNIVPKASPTKTPDVLNAPPAKTADVLKVTATKTADVLKTPPAKTPDVLKAPPTKTPDVLKAPPTKTSVSDPFECVICFERFTCDGDHLPCSLSCGHSLCISHVRELSHCPVCRQTIDKKIPPRPNFSLRDVLVLLNKKSSPLP